MDEHVGAQAANPREPNLDGEREGCSAGERRGAQDEKIKAQGPGPASGHKLQHVYGAGEHDKYGGRRLALQQGAGTAAAARSSVHVITVLKQEIAYSLCFRHGVLSFR